MFEWKLALGIGFMVEISCGLIDTQTYQTKISNFQNHHLCAEILFSNFVVLIEGFYLTDRLKDIRVDIDNVDTWDDDIDTCSDNSLFLSIDDRIDLYVHFEFNFAENEENKTFGLSFIKIYFDFVKLNQTNLDQFSITFPINNLDFPNKYTRFKCNRNFEFKIVQQKLKSKLHTHYINSTLKFSNFKSNFYIYLNQKG